MLRDTISLFKSVDNTLSVTTDWAAPRLGSIVYEQSHEASPYEANRVAISLKGLGYQLFNIEFPKDDSEYVIVQFRAKHDDAIITARIHTKGYKNTTSLMRLDIAVLAR